MGGALARVFRVARETQRLGAVERRRGADRTQTLLARLTLLHNLLGDVGLPRSRLLVSSRRHGNGQLGCVEDRARGIPTTKGARICTVSRARLGSCDLYSSTVWSVRRHRALARVEVE